MTKQFTGSCLCEEVKFKIFGSFESFFLCHCKRCRKSSGSAFGAKLFSKSAKITWLNGREKIKTYKMPQTRHERSFCQECGTALPMLQMNDGLLVVPAGSLDTPISIKPNAHIFYASRPQWNTNLDCLEKINGLPS